MMQSPISLAEIKLTLMAAKVEYEQLEECLIWAFGNPDTPIKEWKDSWNSRHSELFEMKGTDTVFDSIYTIGIAYCNTMAKSSDDKPIEKGSKIEKLN